MMMDKLYKVIAFRFCWLLVILLVQTGLGKNAVTTEKQVKTKQEANKKLKLLNREEIWNDKDSIPVFEETFNSSPDAASGAKTQRPQIGVYKTKSKALYNDRLAGAGFDGSDCWMMEFDIPAKGRAKVRFPIPATDPKGLYYSFLMKIETDPPFGATDLAVTINAGNHPFAHSIYYSEPLEKKVLKTGEWISRIRPIWRGHCDVIYPGWTRFEGDTSGYFGRNKRSGQTFNAIWFYLLNRSDQARHVKLFVDDIKVIRRDVVNSPEMKAVLNTPRPVINYTHEQIQRAKKHVAEKGGKEAPGWVKQKLKLADEWLQKDLTVPRLQAGYPTKYRCKAKNCKGFLRPDPPTGYSCGKCGKKYTGEGYDKLLAYVRHKELGKAAHALGFAWHWTGDQRYAKRAEAILLAYADAISEFKLGHNWLGTCWLMEDFLLGYDYIYESLAEESKNKIDNDFLKLVRKRIYHYNHHYPEGYSKLLEICSWISILTKDVDWINYLVFSSVGNREVLLNYGLTCDMISLKGPAYHGDIVRALNRVGNTLENCGVQFFDSRVQPVYDVVFKQIFPDLSLPGFGQSNVGYPARIYDFSIPYRYYRNQAYLGFCPDIEKKLIFFDMKTPEADEKLRLPSTHLEGLGLTMLRTQPDNDTVMALSWGAPQRNDPTRLDFQLYGAGGHLIWSSGTTYYGNPLFKNWHQCSLSRNMIVVDEGTQKAIAGKCIFLKKEGDVQVVAAELKDAFPDTRIVRIIALFKSGEMAMIDLFSSPHPRTVDWVCHLPGKVTTSLDMTSVESPFKGKNGYEILKDIQQANLTTPLSLVLRHVGKKNERGVKISSTVEEQTELFLAKGVTGHSNKPSQVCLLRRKEVSNTVYGVLFQPFKKDVPKTGAIKIESVSKAENSYFFKDVKVKLTLPDGVYTLTVNEIPTANGGCKTNIQVAKLPVDK
jgi:hypothetical protein